MRCRARSSAWTSIRPCHSSITALRPAASRAARCENGSWTVSPGPWQQRPLPPMRQRPCRISGPSQLGLFDGRAHAVTAGKKAPWKPQGTWCGKKARARGSSAGGSRASR